MHAHPNQPHDSHEPLVCLACKANRGMMWDWKMEKLGHGVCAACRDHVVATQRISDGCTCVVDHFGQAKYTWPVHNSDRVSEHMCHEHDFQHFVDISRDANTELWWRMTHERVPNRKRNTGGHGWTRPKGKRVGARGVLRERTTPAQRRANTRLIQAHLRPAPVPTCFCGEKIHARGHARVGVPHKTSPTGEPLTMRVRNCVGCGNFRRNW